MPTLKVIHQDSERNCDNKDLGIYANLIFMTNS